MKILKLALIFLFLAGAIFLALNWGSIFNSSSDNDFAPEDQIDITEKCDEIRNAWAEQNGWDEELYTRLRDDIDQGKAMGMYSMEGFNSVNNCLVENATNKACDSYMAELKSSDFSDSRLQKQFKGVTTIKKAEKLDSDPRVTNVENINRLYINIRNFANSSHSIVPKFDTATTDWVSFDARQNGILSTARSYRNNPLYKDLKQIPGFESALDQARLKKQTESFRPGFYRNLSQQIISYFDTVEPTQENANLFNQIYKNFTREDSDNGIDELAAALVSLNSKISE